MCTVTWILGDDTVELFTNRDERHQRAPADPPAVVAGAVHRFLAPRDADGGGTWVAANEAGLVVCLLNHWDAEEPKGAGRGLLTRGHVVTGIAGAAATIDEAVAELERLEFDRLRGFQVVVLRGGSQPLHASWDGRQFALDAESRVRMPLVSSSYLPAEVRQVRRRVFDEFVAEHAGLDAETLLAFHRSERPEPGAFAVSMTREDAMTVSFTRVRVDNRSVTMRYEAGAPASATSELVAELPRTARSRSDVA